MCSISLLIQEMKKRSKKSSKFEVRSALTLCPYLKLPLDLEVAVALQIIKKKSVVPGIYTKLGQIFYFKSQQT